MEDRPPLFTPSSRGTPLYQAKVGGGSGYGRGDVKWDSIGARSLLGFGLGGCAMVWRMSAAGNPSLSLCLPYVFPYS